ncbi:chemotaxis protein CheW [Azospirillum sp. sgz301742]
MTGAQFDDSARYVVFGLSGHTLALPAAAVTRFLPLPALDRPPTAAPVMAGVFRWQGRVVPVLRMDRLLGLAESAIGLYTTLLLLIRDDGPLALAVERVHGIAAAPDAGEIAEDLSFEGCALAVIQHAGGTATVLDPGRLLTHVEERLLEDFRAVAEERLVQWQAP